MRGEKRASGIMVVLTKGSPPHARGKVIRTAIRSAQDRITPACAGKRSCDSSFSRLAWDHPRMRGEKHHSAKRRRVNLGSPPHARGKVSVPRLDFLSPGITPACAGKRSRTGKLFSHRKDHPRMRGEKAELQAYVDNLKGSPPHARGKAVGGVSSLRYSRITPACAGKRSTMTLSSAPIEDHPRMRGEKLRGKMQNEKIRGSPPHARTEINFEKVF